MSSAFDAAGDAAAARAVPVGPGAGVIDLKFENLKTGGFKVFLLLFLLGVSATYIQQCSLHTAVALPRSWQCSRQRSRPPLHAPTLGSK